MGAKSPICVILGALRNRHEEVDYWVVPCGIVGRL